MLSNYNAITASNGQEGLRLLHEEGFLDNNMPVMNGFQFLKELKKQGFIKRLRALILTNYDEREDFVSFIMHEISYALN